MKIFYALLFTIIISNCVIGQNFNGQWKGGFLDNSSILTGLGSSNIDYVLELECRGKIVSGYSYTYFSEGGNQYYTICKLKGTIDRRAKEIMVSEIERTKFNTPPDFRNCFQTHLLKYSKLNRDSEQLAGTWIPAPNQLGDCGKGRTILYRKIIKKTSKIKPVVPNKKDLPKPATTNQKIPTVIAKKKNIPTVQNPKKTPSPVAPKKTPSSNELPKISLSDKRYQDSVKERSVSPPGKLYKEDLPPSLKSGFQPRIKSLIKTLDINSETITVDFYDNGAVDGDSITVFYNGNIVVSHLGLTEKAATFTLKIDKTLPYNELVMYADNMGTIPPNTALMVVKDGNKQYEVNITSDTEKSGTIRFHYKPGN